MQRSLISSVIQEKIGFSYVFTIIIITAMVFHTHKLQAAAVAATSRSTATATVYIIDVTNCIKCYDCQSVAYHSVGIGNDEFPYWLNGLISGNYRLLVDPPQLFVEDLDEAIAGCPMECISKSIHQKRK